MLETPQQERSSYTPIAPELLVPFRLSCLHSLVFDIFDQKNPSIPDKYHEREKKENQDDFSTAKGREGRPK